MTIMYIFYKWHDETTIANIRGFHRAYSYDALLPWMSDSLVSSWNYSFGKNEI